MILPAPLLALSFGFAVPCCWQPTWRFRRWWSHRCSAMMMFVGNEEKVYIMDKAEDNAVRINNHPAWASTAWQHSGISIQDNQSPMDVPSNVFCASGMHFPNGSFATFGGNAAVGRGGKDGDQAAPDGSGPLWDQEYQDFDGRKPSGDDFNSVQFHLADGTIVMIGGFTAGGYINRNYPNNEPDGGGSQNSFEFFPNRGDARPLSFLDQDFRTKCLCACILDASGRMFLQANVSTILWDYDQNQEFPLPDMPKGVVRVYPASGAVAMLPLTPANKYNPTILFCGVWESPASHRLDQRITPEPMMEGDSLYGNLLVMNGALNGTAGYAKSIALVPDPSDMPAGESLAIGPVLYSRHLRPPMHHIGSRWKSQGLEGLDHSRMYLHPSFYRRWLEPERRCIPKSLSYGGDPFDITIAADQFSGSANDAAKGAIVAVIRPGFTTHAMNMGQRFLQLDHTYTVKKEGTITLHVGQMPPNTNLFQPGPAFVYVTINGIPSNGTYVIVGNGQVGPQPVQDASVLPQSVSVDGASGKASPESTNSGGDGNTNSGSSESSGLGMGAIIGFAAGGAALLAIIAAIAFFVVRRRRAAATTTTAADTVRYGPLGGGPSMANVAGGAAYGDGRAAHDADQTSFVPLRQTNHSQNWSQTSFSSNNYHPNHQYIPQQQNTGYGHNPYPSQYSQASFQRQY
ncbi:copper radical oxidase variant A [Coprinopsis sp. MPI-PUGE-AT-0042]|nr:copper radical oxidase variant A [Coprinopsis sp. MPI-PUGE-AT-0042]